MSERQGVGFTLSVLQAFLCLWPLECVTQCKGEGTWAAWRNLDRYSGLCILGRKCLVLRVYTSDYRGNKTFPNILSFLTHVRIDTVIIQNLLIIWYVQLLLRHYVHYYFGYYVPVVVWPLTSETEDKHEKWLPWLRKLCLLCRCPDNCRLQSKTIALH